MITIRSFLLRDNMAFETVRFIAAIRGFHVYRKVWQPLENESLDCLHEPDNIYEMFAIKTCQNDLMSSEGELLVICQSRYLV